MSIKLIKLTIILIYLIETIEFSCLSLPLARTKKYTLRPIASALSGNMGGSLSPRPLRMASPGSKNLLDMDDNGKGSSQDDYPRSFELIFKEYSIRNRRYLTSEEKEKKKLIERLKYVMEKTKDIPDFLTERLEDRKIMSIVIFGAYLFPEHSPDSGLPPDIEILIITEGKEELDILGKDFIPIEQILKDRKVSFVGIRCLAATVGYDSLKELRSWEVFGYAIRGWREGIAIFGIDPYKSDELSSATEKISHLDFLLDSNEISLKEIKDAEAKTPYDEGTARVLSYLKERVESRTTEAIRVLKEIATRYGRQKIVETLKALESSRAKRKTAELEKYHQQLLKIYDRFMEELRVKPGPPEKKEPETKQAEAAKQTERGKPESRVTKEELSRPEKLNMILKKHPELDTAEKLLAYVNKYEPHLLDAISSEKRLEFLRDFIFLGYETMPLPKGVLQDLVTIDRHCGRRIAKIRETRQLQPKDLLAYISEKIKKGIARSKEDIDDSTYSFIERMKGAPFPCQLFDIARELRVDPVFIIDGKDWASTSSKLSDKEKMRLCRLRKGWTQQDCAIALEGAGLDFGTESIGTKIAWMSCCERGKIIPSPEQAEVIRKVFCDRTLFEEVVKKAEAKAAAPVAAVPRKIKPVPPAKAAEPEKAGITAEAAKQTERGKPESRVTKEELSRPEKLNMILKKHPELDTPEKLLAYVNKYEPHLLDAISSEKKLDFLRDFIFLRYETVPLPKGILKQLPGMAGDGARLDAIREARGMEKEQLCKLANITPSIYTDMVKRKDFRRPVYVFKVAKTLKVDPIYIKKGKGWNEVAPDLEDKDKMFLCRFRKGWTQRDFIVELEEAGLEFGTDRMRSKEIIVTKWKKQGQTPKPEKRKIIRMVLGENSLYEKADEIEKAAPEGRGLVVEPSEEGGPKYLRGVRRTKTHIFFAEHWQEVKGLTPSEIERKYDIPAVSTRAFLRQNEGAAEIYDIVLLEAGRPSKAGPPRLKKPEVTGKEIADMVAEEAAEEAEAEEARVTAEKIDVRRPPRLMPDEPEATYLTGYADIIYEWLKSDQDRDLVDGLDIEEVISDLEYLCYKAQAMIEKEPDPEKQKGLREQWRWIEAKDILRRLNALVATELCDWDIPEIGPKAAGITQGLVDDSARVENIEGWVKNNIKLVPEYDGCWDTRASETLAFSKGTHFNRANLIVAMLRSIGIPAHYRIISFKKGTAETEEHILVEALITIEEHQDKITEDIYRKCRWIALEPIDAERIVESRYLDNIDRFALEKAKKGSRRARDRMEDYRRRTAQKRVAPSQELKAFMAISQAA